MADTTTDMAFKTPIESDSLTADHSPPLEKGLTVTHDEVSTATKSRSWIRRKLQAAWNWLFTDSWTLECASLILAIGSLASIAGVLGYYQDRATLDGPHLLNLNTVISFLGTITKGAMMLSVGSCLGQLKWVMYSRDKGSLGAFRIFDYASRGPLGAAHLLLLRSRHLVSIGCIVTLYVPPPGESFPQMIDCRSIYHTAAWILGLVSTPAQQK